MHLRPPKILWLQGHLKPTDPFLPPPPQKKERIVRNFHCKIDSKTNLPLGDKTTCTDCLECISDHVEFFGFRGLPKAPRPPFASPWPQSKKKQKKKLTGFHCKIVSEANLKPDE